MTSQLPGREGAAGNPWDLVWPPVWPTPRRHKGWRRPGRGCASVRSPWGRGPGSRAAQVWMMH